VNVCLGIGRRSDGSEPSPLYARQRTSSGRPGMSAWCQSRRRIHRRRYPLLAVKPPSGSFLFVRVTSAMSESGTSRHFIALQNLVAIRA
jgi:hypothetical protein